MTTVTRQDLDNAQKLLISGSEKNTNEVEIAVEHESKEETAIGTKAWQWIFRIGHSPIWNITSSYLSKDQWLNYMNSHNANSVNNQIVEFRKVKITKIIRP